MTTLSRNEASQGAPASLAVPGAHPREATGLKTRTQDCTELEMNLGVSSEEGPFGICSADGRWLRPPPPSPHLAVCPTDTRRCSSADHPKAPTWDEWNQARAGRVTE